MNGKHEVYCELIWLKLKFFLKCKQIIIIIILIIVFFLHIFFMAFVKSKIIISNSVVIVFPLSDSLDFK